MRNLLDNVNSHHKQSNLTSRAQCDAQRNILHFSSKISFKLHSYQDKSHEKGNIIMSAFLTSLFLKANMIAPACSAAFPTIGSNIMLIKLTEIPHESDAA